MPIRVQCQCGQKFAAKDELAGKAVKCPKCKSPIKIPSPKQPAAAGEPAASGLDDMLDDVGLTVSQTGQRCPSCRADMRQGTILCMECGYHLEAGKKLQTKTESSATEESQESQVATSRRGLERVGLGLMLVLGAYVVYGLAFVAAMASPVFFLADIKAAASMTATPASDTQNAGDDGSDDASTAVNAQMQAFQDLGLKLAGIFTGIMIAFCLAMALDIGGRSLCITVPQESGARELAIASVVLLAAWFIANLVSGLNLIPAAQLVAALLTGLSGPTAAVLWILFLRGLGIYIGRNDLADDAKTILVLMVVLVVGNIAGVFIVLGLAVASAFIGQAMGAVVTGLAVLLLLFNAIMPLLMFIRYLGLVFGLRSAIGDLPRPSSVSG